MMKKILLTLVLALFATSTVYAQFTESLFIKNYGLATEGCQWPDRTEAEKALIEKATQTCQINFNQNSQAKNVTPFMHSMAFYPDRGFGVVGCSDHVTADFICR